MRRGVPSLLSFNLPSILLLASLFLSGCVMTSRYKIETPKSPEAIKEYEEETAEKGEGIDPDTVLPAIRSGPVRDDSRHSTLMKGISDMIGTPYSFSGTNESGIDCSGFTARVYGLVGKQLPHSTAEQYKMSAAVSQEDMSFGDLVFFNTTGESPSHVGIYLGGGYFAHASVSSGVTISSLDTTYYKKRYLGVRRLR